MSRRSRKKRRQARAGLAHGRAAFPRHKSPGGRTGSVHGRKMKPKKRAPYVGTPAADSTRCQRCGARPGELHHHGSER